MPWKFPPSSDPVSFAALAPEFILFARVELGMSFQTAAKYEECLKQVWLCWGEQNMTTYTSTDLLRLKERMLSKNHSVSRQTTILLALKRFLRFCQEQKKLAVIDWQQIIPPRRPRREVLYLTCSEVEDFVSSIALTTSRGKPMLSGLRLRALSEMLLGSRHANWRAAFAQPGLH